MAKNKKLKQKRVINEDMTNIRNMFVLLLIVILIVFGLYFLTEHLVNKDNNLNSKTEVTIDYDIATIGTMFNRIEDEYYVIIYSSKDNGSDLDEALLTYRSSNEYIKTYYIDLDKKINSIAIGDTTVKKPTKATEVYVNGPTMYRIKNGNVVNCYVGVDDILKIIGDDE